MSEKTRIEKLLDNLFTNGAGEKADRLMLVQDVPGRARTASSDPGVVDLGGWCRSAVRDVLLRHVPELAEERHGKGER